MLILGWLAYRLVLNVKGKMQFLSWAPPISVFWTRCDCLSLFSMLFCFNDCNLLKLVIPLVHFITIILISPSPFLRVVLTVVDGSYSILCILVGFS